MTCETYYIFLLNLVEQLNFIWLKTKYIEIEWNEKRVRQAEKWNKWRWMYVSGNLFKVIRYLIFIIRPLFKIWLTNDHLRASLISMIVCSLVLINFLSYSNLLTSFLILAGSVSMPCMVNDLILRESYSSLSYLTSLSNRRTWDELILIPFSVVLSWGCPFSILIFIDLLIIKIDKFLLSK